MLSALLRGSLDGYARPQANVRHTEDIVELILDANRNSLLGLDLRVSIMTLGLTAGAMVAALFGMVRRPPRSRVPPSPPSGFAFRRD